jgi:malate dehydrogenase (quinone)
MGKALLFGPFAGFQLDFLKWLLFRFAFINKNNIFPMISAGVKTYHTKYLIDQVRQSPEDRINALREYVPEAQSKDWIIERADKGYKLLKKIKKRRNTGIWY